MKIKVTTIYDEKLIRDAALLYWRKSYMRTFIITVILMVLATVNILVLNHKAWISGTFLAMSVLASVMFLWVYFIYRNRSMSIFKKMAGSDADWLFTEEGFEVKSGAGGAEVKWNFISKLIKSANIWLIVYENESYSTFPVKGVEAEALDFIENQVVKHDGKVT